MAEDINTGDLVRVKVASPFKGQECEVFYVEHDTETGDTWYLLDTRPHRSVWAHPAWFERHEIERVTPEESRGAV